MKNYSDEFKSGSGVGIDFSSFNDKISESFKNSIQPALEARKFVSPSLAGVAEFHSSVASKRGIENAVLISDNNIFSTGESLDKVGVLGNWEALSSITTEIMTAQGDTPYLVTLQNESKRIVIRTIARSTLVVVFRANLDYMKISTHIEETASLLAKSILHEIRISSLTL